MAELLARAQNSRKLQNQSTMVVQGHLTWEEAELVQSSQR